MNGNIVSAVVFILVGVFIVVTLREINREYVLPVTVVIGCVTLTQALPMVASIWDFTDGLISAALTDSDLSLLYKAVGTSFLVQYVADVARENGIESIASKAELLGRIYVTSLCIPVIGRIIGA